MFYIYILKYHHNLLKAFQVDQEACLGLTNTASLLSEKSEASFWVMVFHGPLNFHNVMTVC